MFCFLTCGLPRKAFLPCPLWSAAARAQHMMDAGKQPDFANLAALSAAGSVSAYAHVLGKFVQCYGGGPPWAAIKYLSTFSMVDKSVSLGKEYFQAVTEAEFSSTNIPADVFPRVCFHYLSWTHLEWVHLFLWYLQCFSWSMYCFGV